MEYLIATNETKQKIVGKDKFPQCTSVSTNGNLSNEGFPDTVPELIFKLKDKAILTDVVSQVHITARGFLVTEKVKDLLSTYNVMEHRFYPATIIVKGKKLPFFWLHFKENRDFFLGNVDYQESSFAITNIANMKLGDIEINSYEEYLEKRKALHSDRKRIAATKLILNKTLIEKKYDLFFIRQLFLKNFISSRLADAIVAQNITGLDITGQGVPT